MGKATGFLEFERKDGKGVPPAERIKNFEEFKHWSYVKTILSYSNYFPWIICSKSDSDQIVIPYSFALSSFDPASTPAKTTSVFGETED